MERVQYDLPTRVNWGVTALERNHAEQLGSVKVNVFSVSTFRHVKLHVEGYHLQSERTWEFATETLVPAVRRGPFIALFEQKTTQFFFLLPLINVIKTLRLFTLLFGFNANS